MKILIEESTLQQALDALKLSEAGRTVYGETIDVLDEISALRTAMEDGQKRDELRVPVAWIHKSQDEPYDALQWFKDDYSNIPLYTHPINDSLRTAVDMKLDILFYDDQVEVLADTKCNPPEPFAIELYEDDPYAATCTAIEKVAAQLTKKSITYEIG